jgi:hypothetical protein
MSCAGHDAVFNSRANIVRIDARFEFKHVDYILLQCNVACRDTLLSILLPLWNRSLIGQDKTALMVIKLRFALSLAPLE